MLLVRVNFLARLEKFFTLHEVYNYLKIPFSYINRVRRVINILVYIFGDVCGIVTFSFVFHIERNAFQLSCEVT